MLTGSLSAPRGRRRDSKRFGLESNRMKTIHPFTALTLGIVALGLPAGCPSNGSDNDAGGDAVVKGQTTSQSTNIGGRDRSYLLHVPKGYDAATPTPVVLLLHGTGESGDKYLEGANWANQADEAGFIVIAPNALPVQRDKEESLTNPSLWDFAVLGGGEGSDVQFIDAAIADVSSKFNVDASRIYCTGHSSGGGMTFLLGVVRTSKFAAIGVVASPFVGVSQDIGLNLPTIYIQGTADPIVPVEGGDGGLLGALVPPLETTLSGWAAILSCDTPRAVTSNENGVQVSSYAACEGAAPFLVYLIEGQGHKWPGSNVPASPAFIVGPSTESLDATSEIWAFFSGKTKQ